MGSGGSKQSSSDGTLKKGAKGGGEEEGGQNAAIEQGGSAATATNGTVENGTSTATGPTEENGTTATATTGVTLRGKTANGAERRGQRTTSFYETVDASEVLPYLVIGNLASARNSSFLRGKHVAFVLDLTTEGEVPSAGRAAASPFLRELGINYLHVGIEDDEDEEISGHFETCFEFINKAKRLSGSSSNTPEGKKKKHHSGSVPPPGNKKVLVHSNYGLSRTSAIVLAYLMQERKISLKEAQEHLRKCHATAKPNDGFVVQLLRYEQELRGTMSMTLQDFYKH